MTIPDILSGQQISLPPSADRLRRHYDGLGGEALLRPLIVDELAGGIAVVSSFGSESALILDMVARIDPATPVLFLDTGKHFPETLAYRDLLVAWLGLENVRSITPDGAGLGRVDPRGNLWRENPDRCCEVRKVLPLEQALAGFTAWITGRKRYQGASRAVLPTIEAADGRIKVNPLAFWTAEQVAAELARRRLPAHPLVARGYPSIGCSHCTAPAQGRADRGGRWQGLEKTECGIHRAPWYAAATGASAG